MQAHEAIIGVAIVLVLCAGPLLLGTTGRIRCRRPQGVPAAAPAQRRTPKLTVASALLYALAFNLTFLIQEVFLVLPKALTPGLRPTLFHNNHRWEGEHPLASLFQGTGVLAILLTGTACALLLYRRPPRSATARLLLIWMVFNGFFQALPQIVIGALGPRSDVGMAMEYLRLGATARTVAALVALAAIPPIAIGLTRPLLRLAEDPTRIATGRARTRFIFRVATLPALAAIPLIVPFRVPRELVEVVLLPVIVAVTGIVWMQAGAWRASGVKANDRSRVTTWAGPLCAVLVLLFVFQVLLRPGVRFF